MKPNWENAPEWAKWLAMDSRGDWWWYAEEPQVGLCQWRHPWLSWVKEAGNLGAEKHWKETLERRP